MEAIAPFQARLNTCALTNEPFIPLQIRMKLGSPVMLTHPYVAFDGLIAHLQLESWLGDLWDALPKRLPLALRYELPLQKYAFSEGFFYHASVSHFPTMTVSTVNLRKKTALDDLSRVNSAKGQIDMTRGDLKLYDMRFPQINAPEVFFYCVGQKTALQELLTHCTNLGKKHHVGFGKIVHTSIVELATDRSIFDEGFMRPVPVAAMPGRLDPKAVLAYRPPYWEKARQTLCYVPKAAMLAREIR